VWIQNTSTIYTLISFFLVPTPLPLVPTPRKGLFFWRGLFLCFCRSCCYGLNVCVPSKFLCWYLLLNVILGVVPLGVIRSQSRAIMNGINALMEVAKGDGFPFLCEDIARCHLWTWKQDPPDSESNRALIMDFPALGTVGTKYCEPPGFVTFVVASWIGWETYNNDANIKLSFQFLFRNQGWV
jgi:hypothetical protein